MHSAKPKIQLKIMNTAMAKIRKAANKMDTPLYYGRIIINLANTCKLNLYFYTKCKLAYSICYCNFITPIKNAAKVAAFFKNSLFSNISSLQHGVFSSLTFLTDERAQQIHYILQLSLVTSPFHPLTNVQQRCLASAHLMF